MDAFLSGGLRPVPKGGFPLSTPMLWLWDFVGVFQWNEGLLLPALTVWSGLHDSAALPWTDLICIKLGSRLDYVNSHSVRQLTVPCPSFTTRPDPSCSSDEMYGIHRLDISSQIWCASTITPQGQSHMKGNRFKALLGSFYVSPQCLTCLVHVVWLYITNFTAHGHRILCAAWMFLANYFFPVQQWHC